LKENNMKASRAVAAALALLAGAWAAMAPAQPAATSGPIAQRPYVWRNVELVAGGFVPDVVFSPCLKGLAFCRTDIGGVYRTDPATGKWLCMTDWVGPSNNSNMNGGESVAPDPHDPNTFYIAGGMYNGAQAAIMRTHDMGKTFAFTNITPRMGGNEDGRGIGERLNVDPNDTKVLYFGSRHDGLWRSTDAAVTWEKVASFPFAGSAGGRGGGGAGGGAGAGVGFVIFDPRSSTAGQPCRKIYVAVSEHQDRTLYRSEDAGATWSAVAGGPTGLLPYHGGMDADGVLYLTFSSGPGPNGVTSGAVWKLNTDTQVWTNITPPPPGGRQAAGGFGGLSLDAQHKGTLVISTMDRWNPIDDLYRTTDGGATWKSLSANCQMDCSLSPYLLPLSGGRMAKFGWWIAGVALDPFDSGHIMFGTGATIWGTHDATNVDKDQTIHWSVEADGVEETAVLALFSPPAGAPLISGVGDIGGYTHDDLTKSPASGMQTNPKYTNSSGIDVAWNKPTVMIRSGNGAHGYSVDGGHTWTPLTTPGAAPAGRGGGGGGGGGVVLSSDGTTILATGGTGAQLSKDAGKTWTACQGLFAGASPIADKCAGSTIFYALDAATNQMYVSHDDGATFTAKPVTGLAAAAAGGRAGARGGGGGGRSRLISLPDAEGDLWMASGRGLVHSKDGGATFTAVDTITNVGPLSFGKAAPGQTNPALFASGRVGNVSGVFRSDNDGQTWVRVNDDAHQFGGSPTVLCGDPRVFGRVYLGFNGRGIQMGEPQGAE
jgi:hypothetical protein